MAITSIPSDLAAEEAIIGSALLSEAAAMVAVENIRPDDFYSPTNSAVFAAIRDMVHIGHGIDAVTVCSRLNKPELVSQLSTMMLNAPSASNILDYVRTVVTHSASRRLMSNLDTALSELSENINPYQVANQVEKAAANLGSVGGTEPEAVTISELALTAEQLAPPVIPGMMNLDYRTIVVAEEGSGKSMLLRTIAMAASQGFHPFSHQRIEPVRALIVDLENPAQAILQTASPFMHYLGSRDPEGYDEDRLKIWRRPAGIEIRRLEDKAELQREIAAHRPQLVCIGPIYKMYRRGSNESYEDSADEAMAVLDDLRTRYGFALVMEHHAAKGRQGEKRDLSPMGSQRWMAWPEIGISLYKDQQDPTMMHVKRYRGDRLGGVDWPTRLVRDKNWLFDGIWDGGIS